MASDIDANGSENLESSVLVGTADNKEQPNYDAIFGPDYTTRKYSTKTVLGDVRNPRRLGWVELFFLFLSCVAFLGTLAITIERFVSFKNNFNNTQNTSIKYRMADCNEWTCTSDFTYTVLLIINIVFCLFYAFDGVLREKGFEIMAVPVATFIVLVYIIANYIYKLNEVENPYRISRLILAVIFGPPLIVFAVWVYIRNGRLMFNMVGSNKTLMSIYRKRSFANTLLTFNIHLLSNFVVLVIVRDLTFINSIEKIFLLIFGLYVLFITPIGWCGYNYEVKLLTIMFGIFFIPSAAYYIYKITNVGRDINKYWHSEGNYDGSTEAYRFVALTLLIVCTIGLLLYGLILTFTIIVLRDYNKGLNEKVKPPFMSLCAKMSKAISGIQQESATG